MPGTIPVPAVRTMHIAPVYAGDGAAITPNTAPSDAPAGRTPLIPRHGVKLPNSSTLRIPARSAGRHSLRVVPLRLSPCQETALATSTFTPGPMLVLTATFFR